MSVELVVDSREHQIIALLKDKPEVKHTVETIKAGDYLIKKAGKVVACLERKTYSDFAASLKDLRYTNYVKMVQYRDETGCALFYIIEGKTPRETDTVSGIKYTAIKTAITKLMIRHSIMIVWTADLESTIGELQHMVACYVSEHDQKLITGTFETSEEEKNAIRMLSEVPGILTKTAVRILEQATIFELLTTTEIDNLRNDTKRLNSNIIDNLKKLRAGIADRKQEESMIRSVKGVGPVTVGKLVDIFDLIRKNKKMPELSVGSKLRDLIVKTLNFKYPCKK